MNFKNIKNRKKELGALLLLEAIIASTIITTSIIFFYKHEKSQKQELMLHEVSNRLVQFNNAVRGYVAEHTYDSVAPDSQNGVEWLKATSCGGSSIKPYLPCDFPEKTSLGQTFFTEFTKSGEILSAKTILSKPVDSIIRSFGGGDKYAWVIAEKIAFYARSEDTGLNGPTLAVFWDIKANPGETMSSPASNPNFGVVELNIRSIYSVDAWLRTDGSNKMLGTLHMNNHNIEKVPDISNNGNGVTISDDLYITGKTTGIDFYGKNLYLTQNIFANAGVFESDVILKSVKINGSPVTMTKGVYDVKVVNTGISSGATVNKPTCPTGLEPKIFTAIQNPMDKDNSVVGQYFGSFIVVSNSSNSWNVKTYYREDNGGDGVIQNKQFVNNELGSRVIVMTKCS